MKINYTNNFNTEGSLAYKNTNEEKNLKKEKVIQSLKYPAKTTYTYYFNMEGSLACEIIKDEKKFSLKKEKVIQSLKYLDDIPFDNIQVFKHSIKLSKGNSEICLRDLDLFVKHRLDQHIPKLYQIIEEALKNYSRSEAKKRKKQNIPLNKKVTVVMGSILMATLVFALSKNIKSKESKFITIEPTLLYEEDIAKLNDSLESSEELEDANLIEENDVNLEQIFEAECVNNTNTQGNVIYLDFEKTSDLVKKEYGLEFKELANWCGEKWGISPNLILMQLTQESAGKGTNLMQIEWDAWAGKPIRAYNFRDNKYETFLLTNNATEEERAKYTIISEEDLKNPKTNMSIGCVILRNSAEAMDYHIMASLQCYNLGMGNMDKIFAKIEEETGQTKEEILSDQTNISFYEYTYLPGEGDLRYLSNVFQFIDDYGEDITFKRLYNGEVIEEKINVYSSQQVL